MSFERFSTLTSRVVPLGKDNIDTDQIIPARFLKKIVREKYGELLFNDWRYGGNGEKLNNFILNNPVYEGEVLLTGSNFGCGSSREHAAWALYDYGFRVIIAKSFADIFKNNALNIGLLPIEVSEQFYDKLKVAVQQNPETKVFIDLKGEEIKLLESGEKESFCINEYKKSCLLSGFDDVDYLLNIREDIERYEKTLEEETVEITLH